MFLTKPRCFPVIIVFLVPVAGQYVIVFLSESESLMHADCRHREMDGGKVKALFAVSQLREKLKRQKGNSKVRLTQPFYSLPLSI